jgi:hypothetical protein
VEPIAQRLSLAIVEEHELVLCATKQLWNAEHQEPAKMVHARTLQFWKSRKENPLPLLKIQTAKELDS